MAFYGSFVIGVLLVGLLADDCLGLKCYRDTLVADDHRRSLANDLRHIGLSSSDEVIEHVLTMWGRDWIRNVKEENLKDLKERYSGSAWMCVGELYEKLFNDFSHLKPEIHVDGYKRGRSSIDVWGKYLIDMTTAAGAGFALSQKFMVTLKSLDMGETYRIDQDTGVKPLTDPPIPQLEVDPDNYLSVQKVNAQINSWKVYSDHITVIKANAKFTGEGSLSQHRENYRMMGKKGTPTEAGYEYGPKYDDNIKGIRANSKFTGAGSKKQQKEYEKMKGEYERMKGYSPKYDIKQG